MIRSRLTLIALVLAIVLPACASAHEPAPCSTAFPFSEGNPWRVLEISSAEFADALWLIDEDPELMLFSTSSEQPDCHTIAFKDVSQSAKATQRFLELLEILRERRLERLHRHRSR